MNNILERIVETTEKPPIITGLIVAIIYIIITSPFIIARFRKTDYENVKVFCAGLIGSHILLFVLAVICLIKIISI
jgi:hypothetical protein